MSHVLLQEAATISSLLLLFLYSQSRFCWKPPLPEQTGLLYLAKFHPENDSRAQCLLAAGKNKPQMYFDAAAGATSPSLKNTTSCQSKKQDVYVCVMVLLIRGASFRIVLKRAIGVESAGCKI